MRKPASTAAKAAQMACRQIHRPLEFLSDRPVLFKIFAASVKAAMSVSKFIERRHLPVTYFIPMVLMNPKQIQEQQNHVIVP